MLPKFCAFSISDDIKNFTSLLLFRNQKIVFQIQKNKDIIFYVYFLRMRTKKLMHNYKKFNKYFFLRFRYN
nr:MAG TPA: hypothetical protein [Caudoviricetes sp.]